MFIGLCAPRCDLSTFQCAYGTLTGTCLPLGQCDGFNGVCVPTGPGVAGAACTAAADCGQDLVCAVDNTCQPLCRDTGTACATGSCSNEFACDAIGVCR